MHEDFEDESRPVELNEHWCDCGELMDQDCKGNPRCPACDDPCLCCNDGEPFDFRDDVDADADALANIGWGTDEDYGDFGGDDF
jgi:hypothetical protein